jgi:large subunit ribosomal protein L3
MNGLLGKKLGMTQVFDPDGRVTPVTVIEAGPCCVVQIKTPEKDKYGAVQLAFDPITKKDRVNQPTQGHFQHTEWKGARFIRELRMKDTSGLEVGQEVKADIFAAGDPVQVTGISKGKGFLGVMGRHNFSGGPETHGSMCHRAPGSIGQSAWPSRVRKGMKMGGHTGSRRVTLKGLTVSSVDVERNLVLIKGAVPGSVGSFVIIRRKQERDHA